MKKTKKDEFGPDTLKRSQIPTIVRSDGLFRLNVTLAKAHAINGYALYLLNPDLAPPPLARRLREAAETLSTLEENLEYLYHSKQEKLLKEMKRRRRK